MISTFTLIITVFNTFPEIIELGNFYQLTKHANHFFSNFVLAYCLRNGGYSLITRKLLEIPSEFV